MKNIAFYLLAIIGMAVSLSACSDDDTQQHMPQIFFDQHYYTLGKTSVDLILNADEAPASDVSIPVYFGGEAEEGVDFEMPEKVFTMKAGEKEASLTINRLTDNIGEDNLDLFVNLKDAPAGFNFGLSNFAEVTLLGNNGVIMAFTETEGTVKNEDEFEINLTNMKGKRYYPSVATNIELEVDESSTAVEGEHFEFVGGAYASVRKNRYKGTFGIKFLKKEEGKDKLVLRFADKEGYAPGTNSTMTLTLKGPDNFTGTWAFDKVSNAEYLSNSYYPEWGLNIEKLPTGTADDQLTFEGSDYTEYTFTPNLTGDLKNYFGTSSRKATYIGEKELSFEEYSGLLKVTILSIPDVNINFSTTYSDYSRAANVAFRLIEDENGEEILECTIYDFEPKGDDYGGAFCEMMGDYSMMEYIAPRIHFKRVK